MIKNITVLYHESTFLEDQKELAFPTKHATAKQAAIIAREAGVEKLILGHYSTRYDNIELFRSEASEIFQDIILADDGKEITVE